LVQPDLETKIKKINSIRPSVLSINPIEINNEKIEAYKNSDPTTLSDKDFLKWIAWWQTHFSTEDYFKFLASQDNDYLTTIFHLYNDNKDNVILSDEEIRLAEAKKKAEKERSDRIEEMNAKKSTYEAGYWNANTVLLGGLGKNPSLDDDPIQKLKDEIEEAQKKNRKIIFFRSADDNSAKEKYFYFKFYF
jgi:hypothetical protein